jgi:hypothetical protein
MSRRIAPLVLALVLVSAAVAVAIPASAAQTNVAIQSVDVSVNRPAPGEPFTLTVTVANLQSSSGPVEVKNVFVRKAGTTTEYARVKDTGTIAVGGQLSIPLTVRIDEPGGKRLAVHVVVQDSDGDFRQVNYPIYVQVEEPDEAVISFSDLDPVAGEEGTVNVTVSNGDTAPLSNVQLHLGGDANVENPERVRASLAPGTQTAQRFRVTFPETGTHSLEAALKYKTSAGSTRTVERTITVDVDRATIDPALSTAIETANGSSVVRAELEQFGNVDLRDVQIRALQDDVVVARTSMPDVPAEGTRTVSLDSSTIADGTIAIVAEFTAAGERRTVRETLEHVNDVELDVTSRVSNGSSAIQATVTQYGTVELRNVQLRAEVNGSTVARKAVPNVLAEESRTVVFDGEDVPAGTVTVVAEFVAGSERRSERVSIQYSPAPTADITLTGIEVERVDEVLTLSGDAANAGSARASSVILRVVPTEGVTPMNPKKEFFVGTIDASEFATFELTANASTAVDEIPIEIQYTVDGERRSRIVTVDVAETPEPERGGSGGLISPLAIGIALVAILAIGVGAYQWRKRQR